LVQSRYGKLSIQPDGSLIALTVQAARTEVFLYPKRMDDFQYDVETSNATIRVPENYTEYLDPAKRRFNYPASSHKPTISITNSYSSVVIQQAMGGMTLAK
jgi:hypothetical protein